MHSVGAKGILIGPVNVVALICKSANGIESVFLETNPFLVVKKKERNEAAEALLECLSTVFAHCFNPPLPSP